MTFSFNKKYDLIFICISGFVFFFTCLEAHSASLSISVTDQHGELLPDAVIYAEIIQGLEKVLTNEVLVDQKDKMFHPFVTVTTVGSTARFPNLDGIGHHVYSFSPVKSFQLPLSESEESDPVILDKPGVITVGCNIHDWMAAYIYVIETPYYAVSGADGTAKINDLPDGTYHIKIWHPGIKADMDKVRDFTVVDNQDSSLEASIEIKPEFLWRPKPPENKEQEY